MAQNGRRKARGPEVGIFLVAPQWRWTIISKQDSLEGNDGVQVKNRSRQKHYFPKWHVVTKWNRKIANTLGTFVGSSDFAVEIIYQSRAIWQVNNWMQGDPGRILWRISLFWNIFLQKCTTHRSAHESKLRNEMRVGTCRRRINTQVYLITNPLEWISNFKSGSIGFYLMHSK